ncbi:MAG: hypothetical protein AAF772_20615 [Acidobacteriota bacterium]
MNERSPTPSSADAGAALSPADRTTRAALLAFPPHLLAGDRKVLDALDALPADAVARCAAAGDPPHPALLALHHLAVHRRDPQADLPTLEIALACRRAVDAPHHFAELLVESASHWAQVHPSAGVAMGRATLAALGTRPYRDQPRAHALGLADRVLTLFTAHALGYRDAPDASLLTVAAMLDGLHDGDPETRWLITLRRARLAALRDAFYEAYQLVDRLAQPRAEAQLSGLEARARAARLLMRDLTLAQLALQFGDARRATQRLTRAEQYANRAGLPVRAIEHALSAHRLMASILRARDAQQALRRSPGDLDAVRARLEAPDGSVDAPRTPLERARLERLVGQALRVEKPDRAAAHTGRALAALIGLDHPWEAVACLRDLHPYAAEPINRAVIRAGVVLCLRHPTLRAALTQAYERDSARTDASIDERLTQLRGAQALHTAASIAGPVT